MVREKPALVLVRREAARRRVRELEIRKSCKFPGIEQIFLERANHALGVGVPFRVAVTRENLADSERFAAILVRFQSRLSAVVTDQERAFAFGNFRDSLRKLRVQSRLPVDDEMNVNPALAWS